MLSFENYIIKIGKDIDNELFKFLKQEKREINTHWMYKNYKRYLNELIKYRIKKL